MLDTNHLGHIVSIAGVGLAGASFTWSDMWTFTQQAGAFVMILMGIVYTAVKIWGQVLDNRLKQDDLDAREED